MAADLLRRGDPLRIKARGGSMAPFVRDGDRALVLPTPAATVRIGDVICYAAPTGALVLHRVIARHRDDFVTKGDALRVRELVGARQLLGRVVAVEREGRVRSLTTRGARGRLRAIAAVAPALPSMLAIARQLRRVARAAARG